ncbi:unnamed protein product [Pleuronectes platessa]|uniref:Uncharacterized protein n=1 Tax=Pleuronectes platessa TaxID=8262 RepID=A0A9N7UER2_PLEPL|nr:unnamed protein product [Pleuronectes platessa]
MGGLQPIPADFEQETLDMSPVHHRVDIQRQQQFTLTFTPTGDLQSPGYMSLDFIPGPEQTEEQGKYELSKDNRDSEAVMCDGRDQMRSSAMASSEEFVCAERESAVCVKSGAGEALS